MAFDIGGGHLFKITQQAIARVVDQNVDAIELFHRLIDGRFYLCLIGNVQLDKRKLLAAMHPSEYDDASHFNREYKRLFGNPPMRDVEQPRKAVQATASS